MEHTPISATEGRGEAFAVSGCLTSAEQESVPTGLAAPKEDIPDVELMKKGWAYAERAIAEAGGVSFITITNGDPKSIGDAIERLLDMLDAMEPDPDLEETADDEPYIGWPNAGQPTYSADDREEQCEGEGDWDGLEPTLGSPCDYHGGFNQAHWAQGWTGEFNECEEENEHGGDINDEPQDDDELDDDRSALSGIAEWGTNPRGSLPEHGRCFDASLMFQGDGRREAMQMLRSRRAAYDPDQCFQIAPGVVRVGGRP